MPPFVLIRMHSRQAFYSRVPVRQSGGLTDLGNQKTIMLKMYAGLRESCPKHRVIITIHYHGELVFFFTNFNYFLRTSTTKVAQPYPDIREPSHRAGGEESILPWEGFELNCQKDPTKLEKWPILSADWQFWVHVNDYPAFDSDNMIIWCMEACTGFKGEKFGESLFLMVLPDCPSGTFYWILA